MHSARGGLAKARSVVFLLRAEPAGERSSNLPECQACLRELFTICCGAELRRGAECVHVPCVPASVPVTARSEARR